MKVPRISRRKFYSALLGTPLAMFGHAAAVEPEWLKVRRFTLPNAVGQRLAHITDIHYKGDRAFLSRVVEVINAEAPDFVCFTGDLIEENEHLADALEILCGVKAPLYGIPGNHDYWADMDFDLPQQAFAAQGGKWLMDEELAVCGGKVRLFGMSATRATEFKPRPHERSVLLSHYPSGVESFPDTRFDLVLAGHSHGGQVRLPGMGALVVPFGVGEYDLGWFDTPAGPLYVNPGIGYFYMNLRFCCRPEVTIIDI